MNYLAHLALSEKIEPIIIGNLIEDFITGRIDHPRNAFLPKDIKVGAMLHRHIDTFTDKNVIVDESKAFFYETVGKYASVTVDICYDHFLAVNWQRYHNEPLEDFCDYIYLLLPFYEPLFPPSLKRMVDSMLAYRWLADYQYDFGIHKALQNVGRRIDNPDFVADSMRGFTDNYAELNEQFNRFYPELRRMASAYIAENYVPSDQ